MAESKTIAFAIYTLTESPDVIAMLNAFLPGTPQVQEGFKFKILETKYKHKASATIHSLVFNVIPPFEAKLATEKLSSAIRYDIVGGALSGADFILVFGKAEEELAEERFAVIQTTPKSSTRLVWIPVDKNHTFQPWEKNFEAEEEGESGHLLIPFPDKSLATKLLDTLIEILKGPADCKTKIFDLTFRPTKATITMLHAKNVMKADTVGWADPYCKFYLGTGLGKVLLLTSCDAKSAVVKTKEVKNSANPVWTDSHHSSGVFELKEGWEGLKLVIELWDKDLRGQDPMGHVTYSLDEARGSQGSPIEQKLKPMKKEKATGTLHFKVVFQ